jgi:exonuclease SbcC
MKMILNSLIIDNIRSYEHEEIEFPRGISLFEGDIGSGKSTVLMSIEFALFGLGSQKAESLLSKKYDSGSVILDFSVDGEKYEIKRTLLRKNSRVNQDPSDSWIKIAGEKELLSPSELKQRVLQVLKFNEPTDPKAESKIFRYAIFTPQEAMKEVLFDSRRRLETIRKAFGIEDYSIAHSNAREVLMEISKKSAVLKERFSDIRQLESEIAESREMISKIELEISQNEKENAILKTDENKKVLELKQLQSRNNDLVKLELRKENLEEKIATGKARIESIEQEFTNYEIELKEDNEKLEKLLEIKKPETTKSIPEIIKEIKKFQEISDKLIKAKSEKESISDDISRLKEKFGEKINSDVTTMQNALKDLQEEKESLARFTEEIVEKLDKVKGQQVQKQTLKERIEKEISEFSHLGNACPTCKQEITKDHHHVLVNEKEKEVESLNIELKSITDSYFESNSKAKEIQNKLETYEKEISEIQIIIPGIEEFNSKSSKLHQLDTESVEKEFQDSRFEGKNPVEYYTELKDNLMKFENVTDQIKQIIESKQKVERTIVNHQKEVDLTLSQISEREVEMQQIEKELESFGDVGLDVSVKEKEVDSLRRKIIENSSKIAASTENLKNQTEKINQNESKVIQSKKWESKYKKFDQVQQWLETFFIPTISQIEKQVLLSILQNFNETYCRWYSILVEDPSKESRIDEDFTPIVNQDGYDQEIGYLSGGEKTSIALAYRLTLNSLMRKETESMKSNLLILDEPTDGFSKNQLGKIREVLDELKSEQIILVSHEKELEAYVDNIFQISKQDGISKVSRSN